MPGDLKVPFHVKHDAAVAELLRLSEGLGVSLNRAQARTLVRFEGLLLERAVPAGLVSASDAPRLRERHVLDCLRACAVVTRADRLAYDLGSGAGLPGVVVAVSCPWLRVRLVDSRRRRVAFLEMAVSDLGLTNAEVVEARVQELEAEADICFARALAPLEEAWSLAIRVLAPTGRLVYFAGEGFQAPPTWGASVIVEALPGTVLESAGPLVIMAR